jgi:hypothetical protein
MGKELAEEFETRDQERRVRRQLSSISLCSFEDFESLSDDGMVWMEGEWNDIKNPVWRKFVRFLVFLRCLPEARVDATSEKNALRWFQWASLLADIAAAIVALVTFNGVTYCCGEPILNNFGGLDLPWQTIIRMLTYMYLALIVMEIYPVVKKGIPFNVISKLSFQAPLLAAPAPIILTQLLPNLTCYADPFFGFLVTLAMFFDDSKSEALTMWGIETFAVLCEYGILLLKMHQREYLAKEVKKYGKLTTRKREERTRETAIDKDKADLEIAKNRQGFYHTKLEQKREAKLLWYLRLACYINITFVCVVLALIIFISQAGGLCVSGAKAPNPFALNQLAKCVACTDIDGFCEVCADSVKQCYFPYA